MIQKVTKSNKLYIIKCKGSVAYQNIKSAEIHKFFSSVWT